MWCKRIWKNNPIQRIGESPQSSELPRDQSRRLLFGSSELDAGRKRKLNYDEPSIFDHDLLLHDFLELESGKEIQKRAYDFTTHKRNDQQTLLYPPDVLIVEGIHAFYDQRLLDHMYLKLYMNVEADICLLRRFNRDFKERGRTIDSITEQYLATVKPMYDKYIRNYLNQADVIVMRGGKNTRIVEILAGYLRDALYENK